MKAVQGRPEAAKIFDELVTAAIHSVSDRLRPKVGRVDDIWSNGTILGRLKHVVDGLL
jgi:hypothetical protein